MKKAVRQMEEDLRLVDAVVETVVAVSPFGFSSVLPQPLSRPSSKMADISNAVNFFIVHILSNLLLLFNQ